ncbi:MAG TPA: hypothetical protein VHW23_45410 [Kofleriaceae bacterium]|jgi:hypothetical protein|nr:hypothetical protein [Kofleriaceae bacterium]
MVSGGTRFARSKRSRAAPRVIDDDVDVRPPHKTLYEVLVVPPATSSRQIRRIARALRRNLPHMPDLDEVCLAEQVLGRRDLRAEYDALLARVRAAKLTVPQIGAAIEGSRPPPPFSARFASTRRASADASGSAVMVLLRVAAVIAALAIGAARCGANSTYDTDRYKTPEFQPVHLPPIELPRPDLPALDVDKLRHDLTLPGPDRGDPPPLETP